MHSRRTVMKLSTIAALVGCSAVEGTPIDAKEATEDWNASELPRGDFYRDVDDVRMHFNITGEGPLLIHQTGIWLAHWRTILAPVTEALSEHFTVLTMDARGQGKSSIGGGMITYSRLAADTVALMDELNIEAAHFFGVSDGGCIQLELLLNYEERVKSCSMCGTPNDHDAYYPEVQASFAKWRDEMLADSDVLLGFDGEPLSELMLGAQKLAYGAVSPHPERFLEVAKQQRRSWSTEPDVSLRRLSAVKKPTLILTTDADEYIPLSAMDAMAQAIPECKAVFLEGMTHNIIPRMSDVSAAVSAFITDVDSAEL